MCLYVANQLKQYSARKKKSVKFSSKKPVNSLANQSIQNNPMTNYYFFAKAKGKKMY
jgi:hypothetical protein